MGKEIKLTEVGIVPNGNDPKKWDVRTIIGNWGIIGDRHLKGEKEFPAESKSLTLEEALEARDKWQVFFNKQDERLIRSARKKWKH